MKKILYELFQAFDPFGEPITLPVELKYSEANLAIAEKEAYNGYTIEDDGQPEPEQPEKTDYESRIAALEEELAAAKILLGVE